MRAWFVALALFFFTLSSRIALAEPSRVLVATLALEKSAGTETCIDAPELSSAVEERLGRRVFGVRTPADLEVRLRLDRPRSNEWYAELVLLDDGGRELGRRDLTTKAKDCSALDTSLALVVALLVDAPPNLPPERPVTPVTPVEPSPPPAAPPASRPRPQPTPLQIPRDTFAPREPWRLTATVAGFAAIGVAPRVLFGASVGLGFRPPRFPEFRVTGELVPPTGVDFETGRGAEMALLRVGLALCPLEHELGASHLALCLGQKVGWAKVTGSGFDENLDTTELNFALDAGGTAFWSLAGGFGLWAAVAVEIPLIRNAYVSGAAPDGRVEQFRATPVAASGQMGVGIEF
jgi:hypothetical protein